VALVDCGCRRNGSKGRIPFFPAACNGFLPEAFMTILDRYLLTKFLLPFFYCVSGFIAVWLIWDLSVNLPDFLLGFSSLGVRSTLELIALFYMLQIPSVLVLSIPVGLLLALLYTLTQMSRRNEIISMLCAGRSLYRIFLPLILVGLVMTGVLGLLNYQLAPEAGAVRDDLKDQIKSGIKKDKDLINYLFRNREDHRLWFFSWMNSKTSQASRVEIIQQNESGIVGEIWYGARAYFNPRTATWVLLDARHVAVDEGGNLISSESSPSIEIKGWHETPWKIASASMNSEFLGFPDLTDYLHFNAEFPESRLAPFLTHWHYRLALPCVCLVVIFLAGPMGVVIGRRGIMGGVGTAIGLFAALLFSSSLFLALGKGDRIPAWVAGWGPILIFLSIGLYLFWIRASGREFPKLRLPGF
jgi:lipopolysaccharide export LptBFGC system permease protein LptF